MSKRVYKAANFTDEDRAAIVVRCLAGEKEEDLAREIGTTPNVIEEWIKKVGEAVDHKKITEDQRAEEQDIKEQIDSLQKEVSYLTKQIENTRKMEEMRLVLLQARTANPIFGK